MNKTLSISFGTFAILLLIVNPLDGKNTCDDVCGIGANCVLIGLIPVCSCPNDMTGDPFVRCRPFTKENLCEPNLCGSNAKCTPGDDRSHNEPVCTCHAGYVGNPYIGCTPGKCVLSSQCSDHRTCVNNACVNVCSETTGLCGANTECYTVGHNPFCTCLTGYTGDPFVACHRV